MTEYCAVGEAASGERPIRCEFIFVNLLVSDYAECLGIGSHQAESGAAQPLDRPSRHLVTELAGGIAQIVKETSAGR
jgi:hypothetical protein